MKQLLDLCSAVTVEKRLIVSTWSMMLRYTKCKMGWFNSLNLSGHLQFFVQSVSDPLTAAAADEANFSVPGTSHHDGSTDSDIC